MSGDFSLVSFQFRCQSIFFALPEFSEEARIDRTGGGRSTIDYCIDKASRPHHEGGPVNAQLRFRFLPTNGKSKDAFVQRLGTPGPHVDEDSIFNANVSNSFLAILVAEYIYITAIEQIRKSGGKGKKTEKDDHHPSYA